MYGSKMINRVRPLILLDVYEKPISTTHAALVLPCRTPNRPTYEPKRDPPQFLFCGYPPKASQYHYYSPMTMLCHQHLLPSKAPFITGVCFPSKQSLAYLCAVKRTMPCELGENDEFHDLNKACRKDGFPLPNIDAGRYHCWYSMFSFMDRFNGYN